MKIKDYLDVFHKATVWDVTQSAVFVVTAEAFEALSGGFGNVFPIGFKWEDVQVSR